MAFPLWAVALMLSAGSAAANYQGQKKVDKARANAMGEARRLRERKEKESTAAAQSTADLLLKTADEEKTRAAEIEAQYLGPGGAEDPGAPVPQKALDILAPKTAATLEMEDQFRQQSADEIRRHAHARAALQSFGDVMSGNMITAARNASDIDRANTATRNWTNSVLPIQLEAANQTGRDWNTLADVLQLGSAAASIGALSAAPAAVNTASIPTYGAETAAAVGASNTAAMDLYTKRALLNFAKGMKMPAVVY